MAGEMYAVVADDAVEGGDRKHVLAGDGGDVVGAADGDPPAACDVAVDDVGGAVVGCTVAVGTVAGDYMKGFVFCSYPDAFALFLLPVCLALDLGYAPSYFLQPQSPSGPYSKEVLEEDVYVGDLVAEEVLHVLV